MIDEAQRSAFLDALLRIEQVRQPLTDRTTLPQVLAQVAEELRRLSGAAGVTITLQAACFAPPFALTVTTGMEHAAPAAGLQHELRWGGIHLATVWIAPIAHDATDPLLALLLRVASEAIVEARAAELLVHETTMYTRRMLAADLHDAVKQVLPAIRLLAERAAHDVQRDPHTAVALLQEIREAAQQGLEELSFLVGGLRGQSAGADLHHALDRLLDQLAQAVPELTIERRIDLPDLPWEIAACVLGIVRNALSNVMQHAQAHTVWLNIYPDSAGLVVQIGDDGVGFHPETALAAPGIGLDSMIERVAALGGRTTLAAALGGGMRLAVWLPIAGKEQNDA